MRGIGQRWGVVVAGLLLAGLAGCSGSGKDDGDPFKPPLSSDTTLPAIRKSFKLRGSLTKEEKTPLGLAAITSDGKTAVLVGDRDLHFWNISERKEFRKILVVPPREEGSTGPVFFFPDEKQLAVAIWGARG